MARLALNKRWALFIVGGLLNTGLTYGIYLVLRLTINYQAAYLLAFACGIVFSYWFNARFVFHVPLSWRGFFAYPLVYLAQYLASAALLRILVEYVGASSTYAPLLITAMMVPATYVMSKFVLAITKRRNTV